MERKLLNALKYHFFPREKTEAFMLSWNKFPTYTFLSVDKWSKKQTEKLSLIYFGT